MLVICCYDNHFTAFQILSKNELIYYDPLNSTLSNISDNFQKFVLFKLIKCNYGDSQHVQDNTNEY